MRDRREIVVGLETRDHWERPLDWAAREARLEERPLRLVHAAEVREELWHSTDGTDTRVGVRQGRAPAQLLLDLARARVLERMPDLVVHETLTHGSVRAALLAASTEAHLLVVGSRDSLLRRTLLTGSVGTAVSRHARCPVVVVHGDHPGRVHRGVLVGVDDSDRSPAVVRFAFEQASLHGWPLTAVHVAPGPQSVDVGEAEHRHLADALAGMAEDHPDVRVRSVVLRGEPAGALLHAAEGMNLVVVGAHHGWALSEMLLGSVVVPVVERARSAVAVVPTPG